MDVKSRHHLRSDAIEAIETAIATQLGVTVDGETFERIDFESADWEVVLVDGDPFVFYVADEPFLTVRGANAHPPTKRVVTVDTGAIQFVSDGADVMRPGIVEAEDAIEAGDLVVVVEENHRKALAVGRSREDAADLLGDQGKVIDSIHHVGDELYELSV